MDKKIGCKKCGRREYSFSKIVKKNKVKYIRLCMSCERTEKIYPKKMASALYHNFLYIKFENITGEPPLWGIDSAYFHNKKEFKLLKKLHKEYGYLLDNLQLLIEYLLSSELMEKTKNIPVQNIFPILLNYKNLLQEADYEQIIKAYEGSGDSAEE